MADATATPTPSPLLFGRYRVREQVGETRLTVVYAATDERLSRQVLLHLLRKELAGQDRPRERFLSEISQSARRSHQALLEVFDSGEGAGRPYMISEYVSGRPLRGLGVLTVEQALLYMRQIAGAIAACQSQADASMPQGLYHPPISSSNILLVDEGRVKLVESWLLPSSEILADQAAYRPPELSEGQPATPASAVYSMGLLLYELLTGNRPVSGDDAREIALAHLSLHLPPLSHTRPSLYLPKAEELLARATARIPEHRYTNATAFAAALDGLWRDLGATTQRLVAPNAQPASSAPPPQRIATAPLRMPDAVAPIVKPRMQAIRSGLTNLNLRANMQRPPSVDTTGVRQQSLVRSMMGWVVMLGLLLAVGIGSYIGVNALINQMNGISRPNLPSVPGLPSADTNQGPFSWFGQFIEQDEIYIVNLAEGLNMRSEPNVHDAANIIVVVPNGTPVTKLEGPLMQDNIPWLRVSTEVAGQPYEGWMSLNYLRLEP